MKSLQQYIAESIEVVRKTDKEVTAKCNSKYDASLAEKQTQDYDKTHKNVTQKSSIEALGAVPQKDFNYYQDEDTYNVNSKSSNKSRIENDLKNQGYSMIGKDLNGNSVWRK